MTMYLYTDNEISTDDIGWHRQALLELGGEASLEEIAEHADDEVPPDLGYLVACLVAKAPTECDPSIRLPFAIPSAWGRDRDGRRTWRTEPHWTADDMEEAQRFFIERAKGFQRQADAFVIAKETAPVIIPGQFRFYCVTKAPPGEVAPTEGGCVDGCHGGPFGYRAHPVGTPAALMVELAENVSQGADLATDGEGRARVARAGDVVVARAREDGVRGETVVARFVEPRNPRGSS